MKIVAKFTLALLAGAALIAAGQPQAASAADEITVVSWGGAYQESQRKAFFEPFIADGNKITEEEFNGEIAKIRTMVESKSVTWDVVDADAATLMGACAEGILETIDWGKLGLDRSKFIGADIADCGVPNIVYSTVIAYDTSKTPDGPKTIADVFDLQKFPGKRALRKTPFVNLEWALIADGVPQADVYKVLGTPEGVDRAFKKLDTIKKEVVWWEAGAQPPQLLADGQVVMTSAYNGRIYNAVVQDKKPFAILWDQQALDWDFWVIPKGGAKVDAAYRFIAYASDPARMAEQTKHISYGPANKDAVPNISPDILPHLPTAEANMKTALIFDFHFWADNADQLTERFNSWLAQ
jgi:putative spermidine/putrescine transport system substrate-binding protein